MFQDFCILDVVCPRRGR